MVRPTNTTIPSKSSLFIVLALAIAALYFGRQIFIPLALALVLSFLLTPLVDVFEKARLGRAPAVLVVMALGFALTAGLAWEVAGQLLDITGHIRDYKANLEETIRSLHPPKNGPIGQATATVRELNKELATAPAQQSHDANGTSRASRPVPVQVTAQPTNLIEELRALLGPLAAPAETAAIVVIFTAFILIKREDLRNRLIRLGGEGRLTVVTQALDDASQRLSRYLLLQFLVNTGYGLIFGFGLYFMQIPHARLWGILAALFRLIPYIGTLIATAFPVAMALAVFPGWQHALMIFGLFVIVEATVANLIEPWLYGAHTGISSFAILVAAVFWSLLWGPVGLILSTPLTVCIMLLGRYVPRLEFLEVLLGDEPVLSPPELFYQRLLAMDQDEARHIAETQLKEKSLEGVYSSVLIPALRLAEEDRHMDAVGEPTNEFINQSTREIIDDLGDCVLARGSAKDNEPADDKEKSKQEESGHPDPRLAQIRIICLPARDEADELVGMMFSQILRQAGYTATYLSIGTVEDMLQQVSQGGFQIACVSALPPFAVGQARSLCKRLRARLPELTIMIGLWEFAGGVIKAQERVGSNCGHAVATSLSEALLQIQRLTAGGASSTDRSQRSLLASTEKHNEDDRESLTAENLEGKTAEQKKFRTLRGDPAA
ncbi:MAG TPA: AI-2E family transporter [Candidatus Sulfotelmatobacter sp.]|nr:AI-2E family transporter [Candidatus Sulfotelmatobacter sp.]